MRIISVGIETMKNVENSSSASWGLTFAEQDENSLRGRIRLGFLCTGSSIKALYDWYGDNGCIIISFQYPVIYFGDDAKGMFLVLLPTVTQYNYIGLSL